MILDFSDSKKFRYTHQDFPEILSQTWTAGDFRRATKDITKVITYWSCTTFEDLQKNKNKILARLRDIDNSPNWANNELLRSLEDSLRKEYNNILKNEEDLWKTRSCLNCRCRNIISLKMI